MTAELASADRRAELWERLVAMYPCSTQYQRRTRRQIPVAVLTRDAAY